MPRNSSTPTAASIASPRLRYPHVPRIALALSEAHRVLKIGGRFLRFSSTSRPRQDRRPALYQVIPRTAPYRRPRGLPISGRVHPQVSQAHGFRADDRDGRLPPCLVHGHDRRRGRAAFGLETVIASISHLIRLSRAGYVFAREAVFALVDTRPLPLPAKTAIALARLIERPTAKDGSSRLAAA